MYSTILAPRYYRYTTYYPKGIKPKPNEFLCGPAHSVLRELFSASFTNTEALIELSIFIRDPPDFKDY